jgi:hypothetical protein
VLLLIAAAGVAAYFSWVRDRARQTVPEAAAPAAPAADRELPPLGGEPAAIAVPPLDESDPVVRELVRQLSKHPHIAAWLTTDGLVRNFTVVVANIAEGTTPAVHLRVLRPREPFRVVEEDGDLHADPRSYQRYTPLADAVGSVDPAGAAKLYATLKGRIEEAYRELGYLDTPFDRTLERALVTLLATPIGGGDEALEPRGIGYGYRDARLEALSAAQKQLRRMGPRNARTVQAKLRDVALALGIPRERLP